MEAKSMTALPRVLAENEQALLAGWLESQKKAGALRSGQLGEAELGESSRRLLAALCEGAAGGQIEDIDAPAWDHARTVLEEVSRSRATLGLTPSETATFVLSLKEPLFDLVRRKVGADPERLAHELWTATLLIDKLGLFTTETFQKSREDVIRRQQQELLELSTPVVQAVGRRAGAAADRHARQRPHADRHGKPARGDRRAPAPRSRSSTSPACPTVDTLVAQHLLKTVAAARLMGADCIISGIRPQIAQTIVHLGVDLGVVSQGDAGRRLRAGAPPHRHGRSSNACRHGRGS